jgi:hypothetical protein
MGPDAEHAATAGPDEHELLRLGIASAVAVLRGLGGMIHRDRTDGGPMLLAAHTGLSDSFARAWEDVGHGEAVAPAHAVLTRSFAWMPAHGDRDSRVGTDRLPVGTGLASVPVLTRDGRTRGQQLIARLSSAMSRGSLIDLPSSCSSRRSR